MTNWHVYVPSTSCIKIIAINNHAGVYSIYLNTWQWHVQYSNPPNYYCIILVLARCAHTCMDRQLTITCHRKICRQKPSKNSKHSTGMKYTKYVFTLIIGVRSHGYMVINHSLKNKILNKKQAQQGLQLKKKLKKSHCLFGSFSNRVF